MKNWGDCKDQQVLPVFAKLSHLALLGKSEVPLLTDALIVRRQARQAENLYHEDCNQLPIPQADESAMAWKTVLHSVSYAGVWPGQTRLSLEAFLERAQSLGYDGVMLMAKRPHLSLLDMDGPARRR